MKAKNYLIILFVSILSVSCETDISVDLPRPEEKLNVQASIDLDEYSIVFLTKNLAYFDIVDSVFVENLIISNDEATVVVSSNGISDTLIPHNFPIWPYKGYIGTKIKGQIGQDYNLDIKYNNNSYYSTTSIRDTFGIDSVNLVPIVFIDKQENKLDTIIAGYLTLYWKNPTGIGNYFAIRSKSNKQNWYYRSMMVNVIDDKLVEGLDFINCPYVTKSYARNSFYARQDEEDTTHFAKEFLYQKGDTFSIKLSTIDENSYLFWQSWERNKITDGNPFVNPASVKSNIKGDPANGAWIGYGASKSLFYIDDSLKIIRIPN